MPISVTCPECDATYRVADEAAGKAIKCKKCGARVSVPAGGDEAATDDDTGADEGAAAPKKKGKGKLIGIIVGILLFLTCCVCSPGGYFGTAYFVKIWPFTAAGGGGPVVKDKAPAGGGNSLLSKAETLTAADKAIQGKPAKEYKVKLEANKKYVIDLKADKRPDFTKFDINNPNHDPYLRLLDPAGKQVAANDDVEFGKNLDSQIQYTPTQTGDFTIQATVLAALPTGGMPFHLTVKQE